jgi:tripartite-type tricarboxylate transporter receptor subunit TctC
MMMRLNTVTGFLIRLGQPMSLMIAVASFGIAIPAAIADSYPDRPIALVIPGSAGGGTDLSWRIIEPKLTALLGQKVVIENRPGASGGTGAAAVARAAPDGYTLLALQATHAINPSLGKVPYDLERDFVPVTLAVTTPSILVSHPSVPAKDLKELIAYVKANPGKLTYASAGIGSMPHLQSELFLNQAGLKAVHVPYPSNGQAINDVVAGHVNLLTVNVLTALPHVQAGRLRAYGVTSAKRVEAAPDIPTLSEAGVPGYEAVQWFGLAAPAGTSKEIVRKLRDSVAAAMQDPELKDRLIRDGVNPTPSDTPEEFAAMIKAETAKWDKVVKETGLKLQ